MANEDEDFDPWQPSSGFVDDVDVEITDAVFGYDAQYMNGDALLAKITMKVEDGEEDDEIVQLYSLGKGWEAVNKGQQIVPTKTRKPTLNKNSAYWHFIRGAIECGADAVLRGRGKPTDAAIWPGLRFHVAQVDYKDVSGNDRTRLVPVGYLGEVASGIKAPSKPSGAAATQAPAAAAASAPAAAATDSPMRRQLLKLAVNANDHDAFVEEAYSTVEGLAGSPLEKSVMSTKPGSIWAEAHLED